LVAGPFRSTEDLAHRTGLPLGAYEGLAAASALAPLGLGRRDGIWSAGALGDMGPDRLALTEGANSPPLPAMAPQEEMQADLWSTGISVVHPASFVREQLTALGCRPVEEALRLRRHGTRARVGGVITHRQRPSTANGVRFLNLEDETGLLNVVILPPVWDANYEVARKAIGVVIDGVLEFQDGVTNLVAHRLSPWPVTGIRSRDFR